MTPPPCILCIGGHDPTGGAGIQADIETIGALGGRALTLVTALTVQDTSDVRGVLPTPPDFFAEQATTLLRDMQPDAIKLGMLGDAALLPTLSELVAGFGGPVVLDPVLAAGGGYDLDRGGLTGRLHPLLRHVTLLTPNRAEARRLGGDPTLTTAIGNLLKAGTGAILVTGADEADGDQVINQLYGATPEPSLFRWPRLPHSYHGSGCTLASACAVRLALGDGLVAAVEAAQGFTWRALEQAQRPGRGQALPWRR
ncbi:MAG: hydroxymethylpyrimidine/phosphomethylpyrimidine kinase [Chromatiaceae bacterium]|nr:hydroxymethylpyrimidine/phosphomethylpyrimidine kinase [Chromatiaceae bacterium]MCP5315540.1 hydroxymethylpyrimidine/phosphomethylpyrimidine kinase [Chromatiaceae bacterium]